MYYPNFETFQKMTKEGNLIPIYREILADTETPVTALIKLSKKTHVFLLESVEGNEKWGRYTFLGTDPEIIFRVKKDDVLIERNGSVQYQKHAGNPLMFLKKLLSVYRPVLIKGIPRFYGGAVGFLGYDMVRFFEKLPNISHDDLDTEEAVFFITDTVLIFDNLKHTIKVISCAYTEETSLLKDIYDNAVNKINGLIEVLKIPFEEYQQHTLQNVDSHLRSNMSQETFGDIVKKAKEYIAAGDIIQVVLSQRFQMKNTLNPIDLYRALRFVNPSPYLFFMKSEDLCLIGSSPEVMVRLEEGVAELRPIAGTRIRGKNEQEDRSLADELLSDPKERAEHVMLVDLGRNDLGRIAQVGTIQVNQLMVVEKYSHVMHLVSNIQAQISPDKDCFDVLQACFPAGTLSGAPKVRAMEIIDELEKTRRGTYGGAVGYLSYGGNMDFCITIRTILIKEGNLYIQAGAGIVGDSDPDREYQETLNKAEGMMQAIRLVISEFEITKKG